MNMSYCRFQNTRTDLRDCLRNFANPESIEEAVARKRLVELCRDIIEAAELDLEEVENPTPSNYEDCDGEDDEG